MSAVIVLLRHINSTCHCRDIVRNVKIQPTMPLRTSKTTGIWAIVESVIAAVAGEH